LSAIKSSASCATILVQLVGASKVAKGKYLVGSPRIFLLSNRSPFSWQDLLRLEIHETVRRIHI
jgi:hypothetical protein